MTVFNFDLEDGKPPVSFTLKPEDADRFIDFMAFCTEYKRALAELVDLKDIKDRMESSEATPDEILSYTMRKPLAWEGARGLLRS